jgi:putative heme transporter
VSATPPGSALPARDPDAPAAGETSAGRRQGWRLVLGVATVIAMIVLVRRLDAADLGPRLRAADPAWVALTVGLSTLTVIGSSLALIALTPVRLSIRRTAAVQLATSFANLVTPASAGGLALNIRYLHRCGVPVAAAVAVVGITQSSSVLVTAALVIVLLLGSGRFTEIGSSLPWSSLVVVTALVCLLALVLRVWPPGRAWLVRVVIEPARDSWPQLRATLLSPGRLAMAVAGHLMVTLGFAGALGAAASAFGASVSIVLLTLIVVGSSAVAGAAPVPGGIGAFEAALTAGLVTAGVEAGLALSAALLFRLVTFWARVPIGWIALLLLRRRDAV